MNRISTRSTGLAGTIALFAALAGIVSAASGAETRIKPRTIVTTDGEVDDRSSMLRFLLYTCDMDVAGIIQVNSKFQQNGHSSEKWLEAELDQYEKILPNLLKHKSGYPDAKTLRSLVRVGNETKADLYVTPDKMATKNTEGEKLIIKTLLDDDPRPVHIQAWGGINTIASALWRLKYTGEYTKAQFEYAVKRLRIYAIWYQDGGGQWVEDSVKEAYMFEAYRWDNVWDYQSVGDKSKNPADIQLLMGETWLNTNVKQNHGAYGAMVPQKYVSEGDSPSFFNLIDNGLESYQDYTLGGWGGRGVYDNPSVQPNHITDGGKLADDGDINKMYWRWVPAIQNDFAARIDWTTTSSYSAANHQPVVDVGGATSREVVQGTTVTLDAGTSTDPDGNKLAFSWWQYADADDVAAKIAITNANTAKASFVVPNEPGKTIQVIVEAKDDGTPSLSSYRRFLLKIVTKPTGVQRATAPACIRSPNWFDAQGRAISDDGAFRFRARAGE